MSIQIMEQVKRLSRQLAAAEERIRALEGVAMNSAPANAVIGDYPTWVIEERGAWNDLVAKAIAEHVAEKHTPGRKRSQAED